MKTIKNTTLLLFLMMCAISFGQEDNGKERIKTLKIAHLTDQLALTAAEAQKFWPIYNAHETAVEAFNRTKKDIDLRKKMQEVNALNEAEATSILEKLRVLNEKREKEKTDFIATIQKQFSSKKALQLMAAENSFKRRMLHRYKSRFDERREEKREAFEERRENLIKERSEKLKERNKKRK